MATVVSIVMMRGGGFDPHDVRRVCLRDATYTALRQYIDARVHNGPFSLTFVANNRTKALADDKDWVKCLASIQNGDKHQVRVRPIPADARAPVAGVGKRSSTPLSRKGSAATIRRPDSAFGTSVSSANASSGSLGSFDVVPAALAREKKDAVAAAAPKAVVPALDLRRTQTKSALKSASSLSHAAMTAARGGLTSRSQTSHNLSALRKDRPVPQTARGAATSASKRSSTPVSRERPRTVPKAARLAASSFGSAGSGDNLTPKSCMRRGVPPAVVDTTQGRPRTLTRTTVTTPRTPTADSSMHSLRTAPSSPPETPGAGSFYSAASCSTGTSSPLARFALPRNPVFEALDAFSFADAPSDEDAAAIKTAPSLGTTIHAPKESPRPLANMRRFAVLCDSLAANAANPRVNAGYELLPDRCPSWVISHAVHRVKGFSDADAVKDYPQAWESFVEMVRSVFQRAGAMVQANALLELLWYLTLHGQDELLEEVLKLADPGRATAAFLGVVGREALFKDPDRAFIDSCKKRLLDDRLARTAARCFAEEMEDLLSELNTAIDSADSPYRSNFSKRGATPLGEHCPFRVLREVLLVIVDAVGVPAVQRGARALADAMGTPRYRLREMIDNACRQISA